MPRLLYSIDKLNKNKNITHLPHPLPPYITCIRILLNYLHMPTLTGIQKKLYTNLLHTLIYPHNIHPKPYTQRCYLKNNNPFLLFCVSGGWLVILEAHLNCASVSCRECRSGCTFSWTPTYPPFSESIIDTILSSENHPNHSVVKPVDKPAIWDVQLCDNQL